jgi:multiple sugar transport system permease protein
MKNKLRLIGKYAALTVLAVPFIFPFWWMITSSLKSPNDIFGGLSLLPGEARWENIPAVFDYQPFAAHYLNSVYIALVVCTGTLLVASLAGYAFARMRFRGRSFLFVLLLSSLMMPAEVTIIPNFFLMKWMNLINTHVPLVLIPIFGSQGVVATFLMRQYFVTLPGELEEAATLDGLGKLQTFFRIILPISMPAISAATILIFLYSWNSFLEPLVFINGLELFTLPLSLANFRDAYGMPLWHLQLSATTLSVIPILLVYIVAQKKITNSMAMSGLKG